MRKMEARSFETARELVKYVNSNGIERGDIVTILHVEGEYKLFYWQGDVERK